MFCVCGAFCFRALDKRFEVCMTLPASDTRKADKLRFFTRALCNLFELFRLNVNSLHIAPLLCVGSQVAPFDFYHLAPRRVREP